MGKSTIWSQYLMIVPILVAFIWFDQEHPRYSARLEWYGAISVIAIGAALFGWNSVKMPRSGGVRPCVGLAISGAALVVTELATYPRHNQAMVWLAVSISLTGLAVDTYYRDRLATPRR